MLQKPISLLRIVAFVCIALAFGKSDVGKTANTESVAKTSTLVERKISDPQPVKNDYLKLGPRFEVNQGQIDKRVRYYVRSRGYNAFYTNTEVVLSLLKNKPTGDYTVLRMKLSGANTNAAIEGEDQLEGISNYYIGNDPKKWRTNVRAYRTVRYKDIYDGIDMVHYGNRSALEYDFVVQPGADPNRIQLEFSGVDGLRIDRDGSLVFKTLAGELRHSKPFVYQEVNGERREIKGNFTKRGKRIGFELGNYDLSQTLIIDPSLTYSTFLGGSGPDVATSIALDSNGNAYVTGSTGSLDFPQVNPARSRSADFECFITKLNSTGTALIFSTYLGGSSTDRAYSIAVDSVGAAYVTGQTFSSDYPRASPLQLFLRGTSDAFVTKLTQAGLLVFSTFLGGGGATDIGQAISVDGNSNMYVTGQTDSNDFPTQSPSQANIGGSFDAFVTAINAAGGAFLYSTYLGGSGVDFGNAIAVDFTTGSAYVAGSTTSTNFPLTNCVLKCTNSNGRDDAFITKFNPGGSRNYSTYFGGVTSFDKARGIAIDSTGNAYITGNTITFSTPSDFPAVSAVQPTTGGAFNDDGFVAKLNSTASVTLYSTFLGGSLVDYGNSVAVDASGNAYVVGYTASSNFPTSNPLMPAFSGNSDAFITKLGPNGNTFGFSTFFGGVTNDEATDVALCGGNPALCAATSNVVVGGTTNSLSNATHDFPTTPGAFQTVGNGTSADAFVSRINQTGVTPYIQGTVSHTGGTQLPNVGLSLTGTTSKAILTGSNGQYVFQLLPNGSYTVAPGSYNYVFNPANRVFSNITTPQTGANFSAVTLLNDNLANAINLTGSLGTAYYGANIAATKECTEANHAGNPATASVWYRWTAPSTTQTVFVSTQGSGSGVDTTLDVYQGSSLNVCSLPTAIASNDDFAFDGTSRLFFVALANTTYYIAIDTKFGTGPFKLTIDRALTISGKAKNVNGRGLPGMTIGIDGDLVATTTTNASGNYSFSVPRGGSFTLTPSDISVSLWTPDSTTLNNLLDDESGVNFTATFPSPSITGELKNLTQGTTGVSVTVGGSGLTNKSCNVTSNAGVVNYSCSNLNIHGDYVVTPSSTTYTFNPSSRNFNDIAGDILQGPGSEFAGTLAPAVTTVAASGLSGTAATLNGTVNPRGTATTAAFVWSTSPTFDTFTTTPSQNVGSGSSAVAYSANLSGLTQGTTYYFYAVAQNSSTSVNGSTLSFTTFPQLTIQTSPAGRSISIDGGAPLVAPQTITRAPGSSVTISSTSPQDLGTGVQYVFTGWADGNSSLPRTITVPSVNTTYTANFKTQYRLTNSAGTGGTVAPPAGFFDSGQNVQITATPVNSGFIFTGWTGTGSGSYSGPNNPATVTMNGPIIQVAGFGSSTSTFALGAATYSVNEGAGSLTVTINRTGNTSSPASVTYKTSDTDNFTVGCSDTVNNAGAAFARCDYATSLDTLTFAAGETSKSFQIPIINDVIDENDETFTLTLSNPSTGAALGTPSSATITIQDNDTGTTTNPIFTTAFFVRQHYLDFLSREPEVGEPWSAVLNGCSDVNNNPACDRLTVSGAFFGSPEFQLKGYFVYRFYKLAFNRLPTYPEIVADMRAVTGATAQEVFQKKAAFTNAFALRTEFTNTYNPMANTQYVSVLMGRYNLTQITTPDPANPDGTNKVTLTTADLTNQLGASTLTRAQVLRAIADSDQVANAEFNQAFVAMQYYGYLRRAPDAGGFNNWLNYLNAHPTDSRTMVNGFMNSTEYRLRFGPGN